MPRFTASKTANSLKMATRWMTHSIMLDFGSSNDHHWSSFFSVLKALIEDHKITNDLNTWI
jgi:hypothetical protein